MLPGQRPFLSFQIKFSRFYPRQAGQASQCLGIPIHRHHLITTAGQQACMTPATAGQIKHPAGLRYVRQMPNDPG